MANQTAVTVIYDGIKNCIVQLTGVNDGGTGENLVTKVDVKALTPPCAKLAITKMHYDVSIGLVQLFWDADDPVLIDNLPTGPGEEDFTASGGIQNSGGPSATGNILLSTSGMESGGAYSVKLEMKKKYSGAPAVNF